VTGTALYIPQNATTTEQRREVLERLLGVWDDLPTTALLPLLIDAASLSKARKTLHDTALIEALEGLVGGGPSGWRTFDNNTAETRAWLRAQALNAETRHMVDINELRRLGVIGEDE
jgi:hypothetical protein